MRWQETCFFPGVMPIRTAYLVSRYPAISHTFILREVQELRRLGFEIETASINPPDRPPEQMTEAERAEAARTLYIKSFRPGQVAAAHARSFFNSPAHYFRGLAFALKLGGTDARSILYHLFYFIEAIILGDWMRRQQLKHVHVHFATPAATVAMIATRSFDIEFSMTVHGPDEFYEVGHYRLAEKIERARFICAIGQYCRSQLMKLSPSEHWHKFEVSPLGVDPALFRPTNRMPSGAGYRLICVGRLVPAKGQAVLLQALAKLHQQGRRISLTLVGDGPDRPALERLASQEGLEEAVTFTGAVNQDRIRDLYSEADAFVLPSFAEGIPVVLMEAMAMGLPCISTTITGIPELISSGRDGILVPPSDADKLAEAIALLQDAPQMAVRVAQRGREKVCQAYDLETNVQRLAEILRRRIGGRAGAPVEALTLS